MKLELLFTECEHGGDLGNYLSDIVEAGGTVLNDEINYDQETARVIIEVEYVDVFLEEFKKTDAWHFSQYGV